MLRVLKHLTIFILFSVGFLIPSFLRAEGGVSLKIIFYHESEAYEDYELTLHEVGKEDVLHTFLAEPFLEDERATLKFEITDTTLSLESYELILKKGSFLQKYLLDVSSFEMIEQEMKVYIRDDILTQDKTDIQTIITYATFLNRDTIQFITNFPLCEHSELRLLKFDTLAPIHSMTKVGNNYIIKTDPYHITNEYTLETQFLKSLPPHAYHVRFDEIYDESEFDGLYNYKGTDLGVEIKDGLTSFKLWAPLMSDVTLNVYTNDQKKSYQMNQASYGIFTYSIPNRLDLAEYTYEFTRFGETHEIIDPYAKHLNHDRTKGLVVDFNETNPSGFKSLKLPEFSGNYSDAVIYETSIHQMTGNANLYGNRKDTFDALGQIKTSTTIIGQNVTTGIDHLVELGITHIMLSDLFNKEHSFFEVEPSYRYYSKLTDDIYELKKLIQTLSNHNIRVIMDLDLYLEPIKAHELLMPGYFYNHHNGELSKNSDQQSIFNTKHDMASKYLFDTIHFMINEYNISGVRINPLNLMEIKTLNTLASEMNAQYEQIVIYGAFDSNLAKSSEILSPSKMYQAPFIGFIDTGKISFTESSWFYGGSSTNLRSYILSDNQLGETSSPGQSFKRLPDLTGVEQRIINQLKFIQILSYGTPVIRAGEEFNDSSEVMNYHRKVYQRAFYQQFQSLITLRHNQKSLRFNEHRNVRDKVSVSVGNHYLYYRILNGENLFPDMIIIHHDATDTISKMTLPEGIIDVNNGEYYWKVAFDSNNPEHKEHYLNFSEIEFGKNQTLILHFGLNLQNQIIKPNPITQRPQQNNFAVILILVGTGIVVVGMFLTFFILNSSNKEESRK